MRWWIVWVGMAVIAQGQSSLQAQKASVAKQKAAVRRPSAFLRPEATRPAVKQVPRMPVAWTPAPIPQAGCEPVAAPELARMVNAAADASSIAPAIVLEVARQESAFQPCAVSSAGAQGLMQLMPATQLLLGVDDPFNAESNMMAGARLLKDLLDRYHGNLALALSAYNAGAKRVDDANGIPPIPETRDYVARILTRLTN